MQMKLNDNQLNTLRFISEKVRQLRTGLGINQNQLAKLCEVDPSSIKKLESCRSINNPTIVLLFRVADVLGVSIRELFPPQGSDTQE